jgi:hypothetical protein
MDKMINNLFNYLNSISFKIDFDKEFGNFEIFRTIENFEENEPKLGYTFFIEDKKKFYQQVVDSDVIPDFLFGNKKYSYKQYKFIPKSKKKFSSATKYKLGDIVTFRNYTYINLVIPKAKKSKKVTFTGFSKKIAPKQKFADYTAWKRINFYTKNVTYKQSEILTEDYIPQQIIFGMVIDDSDPEKVKKITWRDEYDPFTAYTLGDIVTFRKKGYLNIFVGKPVVQESPLKNKTTWKPINIDLPPANVAYYNPKKVPNSVLEGAFILPASTPKATRELYKVTNKGIYDPKQQYKLGDIVKHKNSEYINLLRDVPYFADIPGTSKLHWKSIRIKQPGEDDAKEDDDGAESIGDQGEDEPVTKDDEEELGDE